MGGPRPGRRPGYCDDPTSHGSVTPAISNCSLGSPDRKVTSRGRSEPRSGRTRLWTVARSMPRAPLGWCRNAGSKRWLGERPGTAPGRSRPPRRRQLQPVQGGGQQEQGRPARGDDVAGEARAVQVRDLTAQNPTERAGARLAGAARPELKTAALMRLGVVDPDQLDVGAGEDQPSVAGALPRVPLPGLEGAPREPSRLDRSRVRHEHHHMVQLKAHSAPQCRRPRPTVTRSRPAASPLQRGLHWPATYPFRPVPEQVPSTVKVLVTYGTPGQPAR